MLLWSTDKPRKMASILTPLNQYITPPRITLQTYQPSVVLLPLGLELLQELQAQKHAAITRMKKLRICTDKNKISKRLSNHQLLLHRIPTSTNPN
jgi:hypothetical protein